MITHLRWLIDNDDKGRRRLQYCNPKQTHDRNRFIYVWHDVDTVNEWELPTEEQGSA